MKIFIIPSWYPTKKQPYVALFCKEMPQYLSEKCSTCDVAVFNWQKGEYKIPLRRPWLATKNLFKYLAAEKKIERNVLRANLTETHKPFPSFSEKMDASYSLLVKNADLTFRNEQKFSKIDIIHAHVAYPAGLIARELSKKYQIPYIITEHTSDIHYLFQRINRQLLKDIFKKASAVTAVGKKQGNDLKKYTEREIDIIPNIVDEDFFKPKKSRHSEKEFIFFSLGMLIPRKGFTDLLLAAKEAIQSGLNLKLRIGGDGAYKLEYQQIADKLGISNNISWLGYLDRSQALQEFQNCDCFILTSYKESFGIVYAEAMACGKPVIATRCGGPENFVKPETGILVDPGNIQQISAAMINIVKNISQYDEAKIRNYVINNFSKQKVVQQYVELYNSCLT